MSHCTSHCAVSHCTAQWLQQFASSTEVSTFLQYIQFPLDRIFFNLPSVVSPSWDQLAPLSVAPFAGPDHALATTMDARALTSLQDNAG